ncbi:MAG: hypothetical protein AAF585_06130 [Verrucomicrobiota bacterium]
MAGLFAVTGHSLIGFAALFFGLVSISCSAMVYIDTRREFWTHWRTWTRFIGTALLAMLGMGVVIVGGYLGLLLAAVLVVVLAEATNLRGADQRASAMIWGPLRRLSMARFSIALIGVMFLPVNQPIVAGVGVALLITGELLGRALFFRAVTAPKMPGGIAT